VGQPERDIYFANSSYTPTQDADGCVNFHTAIWIEPPMDFFAGYQFRLAWNGSLFRVMDAWTTTNGYGRLCFWNTTADPDQCDWIQTNLFACVASGDLDCPAWAARPNIDTGDIGCANIAGTFPLTAGNGINFSENLSMPGAGPQNRLAYIRFRTSGTTCGYSSVNTGTTNLVFWPTLLCAGSEGGLEYDIEDEYDLTWINTSVTVLPNP